MYTASRLRLQVELAVASQVANTLAQTKYRHRVFGASTSATNSTCITFPGKQNHKKPISARSR